MLPTGINSLQTSKPEAPKPRYQILPPNYAPGPYLISPREFEIRELLYKGVKNSDISKALNITDKTIRFHKTRLFRKIGVKDITGLLSARILELETEVLKKEESIKYILKATTA